MLLLVSFILGSAHVGIFLSVSPIIDMTYRSSSLFISKDCIFTHLKMSDVTSSTDVFNNNWFSI